MTFYPKAHQSKANRRVEVAGTGVEGDPRPAVGDYGIRNVKPPGQNGTHDGDVCLSRRFSWEQVINISCDLFYLLTIYGIFYSTGSMVSHRVSLHAVNRR